MICFFIFFFPRLFTQKRLFFFIIVIIIIIATFFSGLHYLNVVNTNDVDPYEDIHPHRHAQAHNIHLILSLIIIVLRIFLLFFSISAFLSSNFQHFFRGARPKLRFNFRIWRRWPSIWNCLLKAAVFCNAFARESLAESAL